jgi:hypothetical protein
MSEEQTIKDFVGLSHALTGISTDLLAPLLDPLDLKTQFYSLLKDKAGDKLTEMLFFYRQMKDSGKSDQAVAEFLINEANISGTAASLIKLWYLGSWFQPGTTNEEFVVSADAFKQAWVWRIAQAHPTGYSDPQHYGYWAGMPPSLERYTGVKGDD